MRTHIRMYFRQSCTGIILYACSCFGIELVKSNSSYEEKLQAGNTSEKVMLELLWDIDALKKLDGKGRTLQTDLSVVLDILRRPEAEQVDSNLPRRLSGLRSCLQEMIKGVFRLKRTPASHLFVMMISSELRNHKPYAVPVQCVPYAGLRESDMRRMVSHLVQEMVKMGMKVAGK